MTSDDILIILLILKFIIVFNCQGWWLLELFHLPKQHILLFHFTKDLYLGFSEFVKDWFQFVFYFNILEYFITYNSFFKIFQRHKEYHWIILITDYCILSLFYFFALTLFNSKYFSNSKNSYSNLSKWRISL